MTEEETAKVAIARLNGWIPHDGGTRPVLGKKVSVVLRDGSKRTFADASNYIWEWGDDLDPSANIMTYKILND